jgi:hypothetical protein
MGQGLPPWPILLVALGAAAVASAGRPGTTEPPYLQGPTWETEWHNQGHWNFVQLVRRTHEALLLGEIPSWWTDQRRRGTTEALRAILGGPDLRGRYLAARALTLQGDVTRGQREALYGAAQAQADHYALERAVGVLPEAEQEWLRDYLEQHQPPPGRGPLILVRPRRSKRSSGVVTIQAGKSAEEGIVPVVRLGHPEDKEGRPTESRATERGDTNRLHNQANVVVMPEDRGMRDAVPPLLRSTPAGGANQNAFQAYDCSTPIDLELVRPPTTRPCKTGKGTRVVSTKQEVKYRLLQEAQTIEIPVRRCRIRRTILPMYCGNADHQSLATHDVEIDRPVHVSREDCETMWRTSKVSVTVRDHHETMAQRVFPLKLNRTTRLTYNSHGTTWYDDDEIQCEGARWFSDAEQKWVWNMVVARSDHVRLDTDRAYADESGTLELEQEDVLLPKGCPMDQGYCYTESGTYIWQPPPPARQCRMHFLKDLAGEEVTLLEKGEPLSIFSDDQQHVRLTVGEATLKCGMLLRETNFPRLYLQEADKALAASADRPLPDHEYSATLHFKQQAGWLVGEFQGRLEQYVGHLLHRKCESERADKEAAYADLAAQQASNRDGEAVHLGGGRFALPAGEAWRRYTCRPIQVQARNEGRCYDALPIDLSPEDANRVREAEGVGHNETSRFFLTPGSRVVVTTAAEVPCAALLAPVYENIRGRWVQATPALMPSPPPTELQPGYRSAQATPQFEAMPDFATQGLYSPRQLNEVQRRRRAKRQLRVAESQLESAYERARQRRHGQVPELHESVLGDVGIPPTDLTTLAELAGSHAYAFLRDYGLVMAALTGTYVLYRWIISAWHATYRCMLPLHGYRGPFGRLAGALCPWVTQAVYEMNQETTDDTEVQAEMNPQNDPSKPGRYVRRRVSLQAPTKTDAAAPAEARPPSEDLARILERLQALELKRGTAAETDSGLSRLELPKFHFQLSAPAPNAPGHAAGHAGSGCPAGQP